MTYEDVTIPTAGPDRLREVLAGENPIDQIDGQLRVIDGLQSQLAAERDKWEKLREPAMLFYAGLDKGPVATDSEHGPTTVPPSGLGPSYIPNPAASEPRTRRDAMLLIMRSGDPDRVWGTSEIVDALFERGWNGGSSRDAVANSASRILTGLVNDGLLVKLRKGQHRLRREDEPLTPASVSDNGSPSGEATPVVPSHEGGGQVVN